MADTSADPILCFQHCQKRVNIVCLSVPDVCPICRQPTATTYSELPPFRLPSPFMPAYDAPYSVVVRPTSGSFLRDYANDADLHVGITDSRGTVYEYDRTGLHVSSQGWAQCLAVRMVDKYDARWSRDWNSQLQQYSLQPAWTAAKYSEKDHHCYDFILGFLREIGLEEEFPVIQDSAGFCAEFIVPKTALAAKYIGLYRKLLDEQVIVQKNFAEHSTYL